MVLIMDPDTGFICREVRDDDEPRQTNDVRADVITPKSYSKFELKSSGTG